MGITMEVTHGAEALQPKTSLPVRCIHDDRVRQDHITSRTVCTLSYALSDGDQVLLLGMVLMPDLYLGWWLPARVALQSVIVLQIYVP